MCDGPLLHLAPYNRRRPRRLESNWYESVNIAVTCTELCFPQTPGTSLGSAKPVHGRPSLRKLSIHEDTLVKIAAVHSDFSCGANHCP
jgi:hypothetical protein